MSLLLCFVASCVFAGLHILLLSLHFGTILPEMFDGYGAIEYTNRIVQPLETITNNKLVVTVANMVLWGLIGFLTYCLLTYSRRSYSAWRDVESSIQVTGNRQIVKHPGLKALFVHALWKIGVASVAVGLLVSARPVFHRLLDVNNALFADKATLGEAKNIGLAILAWTAIAHVVVVLIRLFLLRTRVFPPGV